MRKHISKQNKKDRTTFSLKKILIISIIFFMLTGMVGVMASNEKVKTVKIVLSSGYEMNVVTTSSNVGDILKENKIVVLDGESVSPLQTDNLTDNNTIVITKGEKQKIADVSYFSEEEILESYKSIIEKVVTVQEEIPYETITKDVSNGSSTTQNKVVQAGSNGIKEVTYRIKYQNGNEIEKTKLSENVIKDKVDKIVEVMTKTTTSRYGGRVSGSVSEYQAYAKARCSAMGWSDSQFQSLVKLWNKESGWNPNAYNRSSGAYGIPQALPGYKMGAGWQTSYQTQINWGINYIKSRYGNPTAAWSHSSRYGWY